MIPRHKRRARVARSPGAATVRLTIDHLIFTLQPHDFLYLAEDVVTVMQAIAHEQHAQSKESPV